MCVQKIPHGSLISHRQKNCLWVQHGPKFLFSKRVWWENDKFRDCVMVNILITFWKTLAQLTLFKVEQFERILSPCQKKEPPFKNTQAAEQYRAGGSGKNARRSHFSPFLCQQRPPLCAREPFRHCSAHWGKDHDHTHREFAICRPNFFARPDFRAMLDPSTIFLSLLSSHGREI